MCTQDNEDRRWLWWVCMHVHLCVCYFLDVAIIQAYYTSSYTDFLELCQSVLTQVISTKKHSATPIFRVWANLEKALTAVAQRDSKNLLMLQKEQSFFFFKGELDKLKATGVILQ